MVPSVGKQKLVKDLAILEAMAAGLDAYLMRKDLFWPTAELGMPKLTLGGYLMRQHRLLILADTLLNEAERTRLDSILSQGNEALQKRDTFFVQKAHRALKSRLRQWDQYLQELDQDDDDGGGAYYPTAVETRAMIAALIDKPGDPAYQSTGQGETQIRQQLDRLDQTLRQGWQPGPFVWPAEWQAAYPQKPYWWLYGRPV